MSEQLFSEHKPKGILKNPKDTPDKSNKLRWDEDNLRMTEAQKDSKMKVDEPKTPYIRYDPNLDADLQEMEDLKLADTPSGPSSVASSPKRAHIVAPDDHNWQTESEEEEETEAEKARHERFKKMRQQHYHHEGVYVHQENGTE